jgi:hypothetical protein
VLVKISRWLWVPRRRYWIWLGLWSLAVATVTIILTGRSRAFTEPWVDDDITKVRQEIGFIAITLFTLLASYLFIFTCKNPPRSWKIWCWLGFASVFSGGLWASIFVWSGRVEGAAFSRMFVLFSLLAGAVVFLFVAALIHAQRNFFRWLFSWRLVKRGLLALAGLMILVVAFYMEENWRGHRA